MSLPVFVHDLAGFLDHSSTTLTPGPYVLSGPEGKHAATVHRLAVGEQARIVDGLGNYGILEITAVEKHQLSGVITEVTTVVTPQPKVTIIQALPKSERSELTVDLLTQAGADAIVPWEAARCIAKWQGAKRSKGVQKWQQAALAAAKQSRRSHIPLVHPVHSTKEVLALLEKFPAVFMLHESAQQGITAALAAAQEKAVQQTGGLESIALIIGPEGGISEAEAAQFSEAGAQPVRLGPEILRTATAGMVALAAIGSATARWDATEA